MEQEERPTSERGSHRGFMGYNRDNADMNVGDSGQYNLLGALKKSLYNNSVVAGRVGYPGDNELLDLINDNRLLTNSILKKELQTQQIFHRCDENNDRIPANFNLLNQLRLENDDTIKEYIDKSFMRVKRLSKKDKKKSISIYMAKREKRKNRGFIRYQVRKDLAVKRKRFKGKFVKNEKMDLRKALEIYMQKELNKKMNNLKIGQ